MWRAIAILVLLAHGIGHVMEPMAAWIPSVNPFASGSWALSTGVTPDSTLGQVWAVIWIAALLGFVTGAIGVWRRATWWRPLLAVSAIVSLVAVVPWWGPMAAGSYIGAVVVDLVVLAAVFLPAGRRMSAALG